MIATSVLSTMLLLATIIMISIGNLYYKGINQARVQDDTHSIADEVAQHLQLSGTAVPVHVVSANGQVQAYCIGDTRYVYTIGVQIGTGNDTNGTARSQHVLWRDKVPSTGCTTPSNTFLNSVLLALFDPSGTELMTPNSRLTSFCITGLGAPTPCTPSASPFNLSVGVAYGDIDLLTNPSSINATCNGSVGDQFCSTASLTTTVAQRLTP